jgi:crotonobetainyl-CoA:carnitine CoA-transferase CaiB-like acyl-CoA transferase
VPCAGVNDIGQALRDPQVLARNGLVEYDHPRLGRVVQARSAVRVGDHLEPPRPAPARGADSRDVLRDLGGYTDSEFAELAARGATFEASYTEQEDVA